MIQNTIITKNATESTDNLRSIFDSSKSWSSAGENLIVYRNGLIQNKSTYSILSKNSIQFNQALSVSEQMSFLVTDLADIVRIDRTSKKLENKTQTSVEKEIYEETISNTLIVHSSEIWSSNINENPAISISENIAQLYSYFQLTQDLTVSDKKGWYASANGSLTGLIRNWIPPRFGVNYSVRLYDANNTEIPSSSSIKWKWDYQSGYLFIENLNSIQTPFKIVGYKYSGSYGSSSGSGSDAAYWKTPVPTYSALPVLSNTDGDVRMTLDDNSLWRWSLSSNVWIKASSSYLKSPVNLFSQLPASGNLDGDIRLVTATSTLYYWHQSSAAWRSTLAGHTHDDRYYTESEVNNLISSTLTGHNHDSLYYIKTETDDLVRWRPSVAAEVNLPPHTENRDGDIILTRDTSTIWRWVTEDPQIGQGYWKNIVTSLIFWKEPVAVKADLPTVNNIVGHVRLVIQEKSPYMWDGVQWVIISSNEHNHDDRYYTIQQINSLYYWMAPVADYLSLPVLNNKLGDVRLTLDTNNIYRWIGTQWQIISASPRWRESVQNLIDLPTVGNINGDARIVKETSLIYQWDSSSSIWKQIGTGNHNHDDRYFTELELLNGALDSRYYTETEIRNLFDVTSGHDHDGNDSKKIEYNNLLNIPYFYWKTPVTTISQLPTTENTVGDVRAVLHENSIYAWDGVQWKLFGTGRVIDHNHDDRYYTETEISSLLSGLQLWVTNKLALKSNIGHIHDDRYYTETEINDLFDSETGHDHDGSNSKQISYYNLTDVPPPDAHNHDIRYYTKTQLQTSNQSMVHWDNVTNKPDLSNGHWKSPVQKVENLPLTDNELYDIRIVLDDSDIYEWDGSQWIFVGHWDNKYVVYWREPINTYSDLPVVNNANGDVRLVLDENNLYRWDSDLQFWIAITGSSLAAQVYLNGDQLFQSEDWVHVKSTAVYIRDQEDELGNLVNTIKADDKVTVIFQGDYFLRQDFVAYEGQRLFEIRNKYYRQEIVVSAPTLSVQTEIPFMKNKKNLIVWLNGLILKTTRDYSETNSTTITFTEQLKENDRIIIIIMQQASGAGLYTREDITPQQGQQFFTLNNSFSKDSNNLVVYLNGDLLTVNDDYTEESNTGVKIVYSLDNIDELTFIIFKGGSGGDCSVAGNIVLGTPTDQLWSDGLIQWWHPQYKLNDAIDDINEVLDKLAPDHLISLNEKELVSEGIELFSGYTSNGNTNYETVAGDYHAYLTEDFDFKLFTPNDNCFSNAEKGILKLLINDVEVDSFNLFNAFVAANANASQSSVSYGIKSQGATEDEGSSGSSGSIRNSFAGSISIMKIEQYQDLHFWQKGTVRININAGLMRQGYNTVQLIHSSDIFEYKTKIFKLFYDSSGSRPYLGNDLILTNTLLVSQRYISGVRYYSIGDKFRAVFSVFAAFNNTFCQVPIRLKMPGLRMYELEYDHQDFSGVDNPPNTSDSINFNGEFTLNEFNESSLDAKLTVETFDPFGPGEISITSSANRLVSTFTNGSTDLIEFFRDEIYRLPSDDYDTVPTQRKNVWNSTRLLTNGEPLVLLDRLMYANMNFISAALPQQTADYSNFTGPQSYYRAFYRDIPKNSGILKITGPTKEDIFQMKVLIDIKLPTQTGWLSLNKYYDIVTFNGEDNDGCLIKVENSEWFFTTATFSTAFSNYMIIVRITFPLSSGTIVNYMELK